MSSIWKIYDRALEIIEYIDKMYVNILEEIVIEEAEILSKNELTDIDKLRLYGLWIMKELIAVELGVKEVGEEVFEEEHVLEKIAVMT